MRTSGAIPRKLGAMIGALALIFIGVYTVNYMSMEVLSAMRAFVQGEGRYARAQKEAVYRLFHYARSHNQKDYYAFLKCLEVSEGDRIAREESRKAHPDRALLEQGYAKGGNQPDDLDSTLTFFRRFQHTPRMQHLLELWDEADRSMNDLRKAGTDIHQSIRAGRVSERDLGPLLARVEALDAVLTPLGFRYSALLGDTTRWVKKIVGWVQTTALFVFLGLGLWMSFRISRILSEREIFKLNHELSHTVTGLRAANKELDSFCYSISHDLRAPLRVMHGFSEILLEEHSKKLGSDGEGLAHSIHRNAIRMQELLDGLLSFSRLSLQPLTLVSVDMKALVESVVEELKGLSPRPQLSVQIETLPEARGDRVLLHQVWANLISNAIKFTRSKLSARIVIGTQHEPERVVYFVQDNGVGFTDVNAEKLFGVFQRLHSEKEFEGNGVGLAIVQRIVHRHGGSVWAKSKEGEGATFYFALPH